MPNILSIQSSARHEGSYSRDISAELVEKLSGGNAANVTVRDLTDSIPHIDENWLGANWTPPADRSPAQKEALQQSDALLQELKDADILVIGAPIYNFSIPAALKAWIDYVCRAGETFRYTENGPQGLLEGKKAYVVVASGGVPVDSPYDFATPYMRQVLGFIGITDVEVIGVEGVVQNAEGAVQKAQETIQKLAA